MTDLRTAAQRKRKKLGEFEFRCSKCKQVHKRSSWSIAHWTDDQTFTCECGKVTNLRGRKRPYAD